MSAAPKNPPKKDRHPAAKSAPAPVKAADAPKGQHADPHRIIGAEFLAGAAPGSFLPAPICVEIAFGGRSNVGKSSLINTLVERKNLVRVSSKPGSTRQINQYEARAADGMRLHLIDLPGYGFTRRSKAEQSAWAGLIEGYLQSRVTLAAVVVLVDIRRGLEPDDQELIDFVETAKEVTRRPVEVLIVATKLDKVARSARKTALAALVKATGRRVIGFSSETTEGRVELWRALRKASFGGEVSMKPDPDEAVSSPAVPVEVASPPDQNG
ncbi:MAG: ribosome biogenesis GTP-binding protein YihA/YsxC [Byssovorax sp.]